MQVSLLLPLHKARIKSPESKTYKEMHSNQGHFTLPSRKQPNFLFLHPTKHPHEVLCPLSHGIPAAKTENRRVKDVKRRSGTCSSSKCKAQVQVRLILTFHLLVGHSKGPWVPPSHLRAEAVHPLQCPLSNIPVPCKHIQKEAFHSGLLLPHKTSLASTQPDWKHVSSKRFSPVRRPSRMHHFTPLCGLSWAGSGNLLCEMIFSC